ncbi:MAG: hypothetical protein JO020_17435 [Chloroflexi bacterium]|nr:hypothetical protein [Chloroflexota bacterium]MBV9135219.1 hypothetical protein [Chloroflexota bacterium]MBV9895947.1 hypothetical protein [Chloroflexota bacterium]
MDTGVETFWPLADATVADTGTWVALDAIADGALASDVCCATVGSAVTVGATDVVGSGTLVAAGATGAAVHALTASTQTSERSA